MPEELGGQNEPFHLEEATIEELHSAIKSGRQPALGLFSTISNACAPIMVSPVS